jgi:hypothetical protein
MEVVRRVGHSGGMGQVAAAGTIGCQNMHKTYITSTWSARYVGLVQAEVIEGHIESEVGGGSGGSGGHETAAAGRGR